MQLLVRLAAVVGPRVAGVFYRLFWPLTTVRMWALMAVLTVLAGLGMLFPVARDGVTAGFVSPTLDLDSEITDYDADYRVGADGTLTATETLTVRLPAGRHGIFRYFPVGHPADPHVRSVPTVTEVSQDGRPAAVHYSWSDDGRSYIAQIGDRHSVLAPGSYTYTIRYRLTSTLIAPQPGHLPTQQGHNTTAPTATFFHNVVGYWPMRTRTAHVRVSLPGSAGQVGCAAGDFGSCTVDGAGTDQVSVSADDLWRYTPLTLRVDLAVPLPPQNRLPWTERYDTVLGRSLPLVALVAVLAMAAAVGGYLWMRRSREPAPGFPVLYAPPRGLGPAHCAYLVDESVGEHALIATLLYLAERRLVRLQAVDGQRWLVTGLADPARWAQIDPVSRQLGERLGVTAVGSSLFVDGGPDVAATVSRARDAIATDCQQWAREQGIIAPAAGERVGQFAVIGALIVAVIVFAGIVGPTMWGLPPAAFAVGGIGLLATGVGTRRTDAGRAWWSQAAGFRRLLATPSAERRFNFAARTDLYLAYIPYAVAFGVADAWAAKYRMATGWEPPIPLWYPFVCDGPRFFAASLDSFSATVSSSLRSYGQATSAGAGMSWGRGGGGGGGTW